MRFAVISFAVANTQTVGDFIQLTGVGVAVDKGVVTAWDGTKAKVSVIFQREFTTTHYAVVGNVFDSGTGLIVAETPELLKRFVDMDITVNKNRRVDLVMVGH